MCNICCTLTLFSFGRLLHVLKHWLLTFSPLSPCPFITIGDYSTFRALAAAVSRKLPGFLDPLHRTTKQRSKKPLFTFFLTFSPVGTKTREKKKPPSFFPTVTKVRDDSREPFLPRFHLAPTRGTRRHEYRKCFLLRRSSCISSPKRKRKGGIRNQLLSITPCKVFPCSRRRKRVGRDTGSHL